MRTTPPEARLSAAVAPEDGTDLLDRAAGGAARSMRGAAALMVAGLVLVLVAVAVARQAAAGGGGRTEAAAEPGALLLRGPGDVSVVTSAYESGQSSGWHAHQGIHAVAVLSGELTVYDRACRPQRVVPGEPYVGGQELHLVRNETPGTVDMVVTYLNGAGASAPGPPERQAPAGCAVE